MLKISWDAGHAGFGITPGKRVPDGTMYEWDFNNAIVIYSMLELANYENVAQLRVDDPTGKRDVPLLERTNRVNGWGSNVHLSIHANADKDHWTNANGLETFVYKKTLKEAVDLANRVQNSIVSATGLRNRGVKESNLHMVRETKMTAILVEGPFMSNKQEAELLKSDAFRRIYAAAIVAGVVAKYNLKKKHVPAPTQSPKKEENEMLEKAILIGGFPDFAVAEILAARLKAPIYTRAAFPKEQVTKELYVVGGSTEGLKADKVINLSGKDRFEVAKKVGEFLK